MENIEKGCRNVYTMSLKNFGTFKKLPGKQKIHLKYGYVSVIDAFISRHRNEFFKKLYLNHSLEKILLCEQLSAGTEYQNECAHCFYISDKTKVVLLIRNKLTSNDLVVICNKVVLTPSLGYMKDNLESLIEPIRYVSSEKEEAVSRLGFGNSFKVKNKLQIIIYLIKINKFQKI
jgi:hypothetical protein